MNTKSVLILFVLIGVAIAAPAQRRNRTGPPNSKPQAARLMVQGTYEETFQGTTSDGNADATLLIKFEAARWLRMGTNEVGNAEFSDLENAPAPFVSGSVTYHGLVKGSGSGGESYQADSSFAGPLGGEDVVLSVPQYTDTGTDFKIKAFINPKLKGKCSLVAVRNGQTTTSSECNNGTYFFTASTPLETVENDDPAKTADTANVASFGIELDVEPEVAAAASSGTGSAVDQAARARRELEKTMGQGPAGEAGVYAWRGAVTNGSKEAGFKIVLNKTKELPIDDKRGHSIRKLTFTATIVPGVPK